MPICYIPQAIIFIKSKPCIADMSLQYYYYIYYLYLSSLCDIVCILYTVYMVYTDLERSV